MTKEGSTPPILERLRLAELDVVRQVLPPVGRVLELGAGSGYQAKILAEWGYDVVAVDLLQAWPSPVATHVPVLPYDGTRLPIRALSCDVVFSSNVLEHVLDLPPLLAEISRVLRPGGVAVHVLPTPTWRAATSVAHLLRVPRELWRRRQPVTGQPPDPMEEASPAELRTLARKVKGLLLPGPHGEFPTAVHELWTFNARHWTRVFDDAGFTVDRRAIGVFYTGYALAPGLALGHRRRVAAVLGSSTTLFVTRRR